ncbi:MFS transporter [Deinococcus cavernae]|uniref:MFS transporter n=1 Tax=Deinococcus cavernae TaxID=2320857 RepID=A0A418V8M5_9DEIO|nr:MFS transporter [Deinococcus cavernae]RJF72416.1 MFS transporter [Deinococcus cavernae]
MTESTHPRRVYLVMETVTALAFALAFTLQGLYFVQTVGLTPLQLLLIGAVLEASAFLLEIPTGVVADVYSRRRSVVLGFLCLGAAVLLVASFPSFWPIFLAQFVSAAGYTFLSGAQQAWIADEVGEEHAAHLFLLASQYARVARIAGILLVVALAPWGLSLPMLVAGGLLLMLAGYLKLIMPENGFHPAPPEERQSWRALTATFRQGVGEVRRSSILTLLMVAALLYGASTEALDRLNEFLLVKEVGLPAGMTPATLFAGLALASNLIGWLVTELLRKRLNPADPAQASRAVQALLLLSVLALLVFAFAPGFWWAAAALVLHGVFRSLYVPLYSAWLNREPGFPRHCEQPRQSGRRAGAGHLRAALRPGRQPERRALGPGPGGAGALACAAPLQAGGGTLTVGGSRPRSGECRARHHAHDGPGVRGVVVGQAVQDDALGAGHQGRRAHLRLPGPQVTQRPRDGRFHDGARFGHGFADGRVVAGLHKEHDAGGAGYPVGASREVNQAAQDIDQFLWTARVEDRLHHLKLLLHDVIHDADQQRLTAAKEVGGRAPG